MNKLQAQIRAFEKNISQSEIVNINVSKGSVGWHIEHVMLVINSIVNALERSSPDDYKSKFNFMRSVILFTGHIPRGRVQSPEALRPKDTITTGSLKTHLEQTLAHVADINKLPADSYFRHPVMGDLNVKAAVRFLNVHTRHHCKIVKDILR